jgi:hypothetical protein
VLDGLVRVLSFGHLHTRLCVDYARHQTLNLLMKMKKRRHHECIK